MICQKCKAEIPGNENHCPSCSAAADGTENISLYSTIAVGIWSFFLTPVWGAWCLWRNYKAMGMEQAVKKTMRWQIVMFFMNVIMPIILFSCSLIIANGGEWGMYFWLISVFVWLIIRLLVWLCRELRTQHKIIAQEYPSRKRRKLVLPVFIGFILVIISIIIYFYLFVKFAGEIVYATGWLVGRLGLR